MADESMQESSKMSEMVLKAINRHLNCLKEDNRNTRKRAIEGIRKEVLLRKPPLEQQEFEIVFAEILKPFLKVLTDKIEKCRELTVGILHSSLKLSANPSEHLSYIIPVFVQRLGQQDIIEPSEEVRLGLVQILSELVELCNKGIAPFADEYVLILQRTINDPFPEVRKESCRCASKLSKACPQQFHDLSENLIKPLLKSVSHQHSRVRVEVVLAIGDVIQNGHNKSVNEVVTHLAQRLFDQAPAVRAAVTQVVGNWLLDLMDRYSFFYKLMPLLLTSMQDEVPDIREQAEALWHDVGLKYEGENEKDLKDKQDFVKSDPEHYPKDLERPNLGCRTLMYHNFSKIVAGIVNDITDWVVETRVKSAQLLYSMMINEEENVVQHMERVMTALYRASSDEDIRVIQSVKKTAELIGYFVPPEVWVKMVLKQVKIAQSPGVLMLLSSIIKGSQQQKIKEYFQDICNIVEDPGICQIADSNLQKQLCSVVESLIDVCKEDTSEISLSLFKILTTVLALARNEAIALKVQELLESLASAQKFEGKQQLYDLHTQEVIDSLQDSYAMWTQHSVERLLFDTLLMEAGPVVGEVLELIIPMLVANLQPTKDAEVRLKFFNLLSKLMLNAGRTLNSQNRFGEFCVTVVKDMILPNLVWRAGRTAGAIRTVAISCLWALLQSGMLDKQHLLEVVEDIMTQLHTTLEDDNHNTRLVTCRVILHIFNIAGKDLNQDKLHNMYAVLMKRLDDSSDDIRIAMCKTFLAYFDCFTEGFQVGLYRAHYQDIFKGLLVHLDDPDRQIQEAVLDVLKKATRIDPPMLLREVDAVKHKHRSTHYCDLLSQHAHSLPKPDDS